MINFVTTSTKIADNFENTPEKFKIGLYTYLTEAVLL